MRLRKEPYYRRAAFVSGLQKVGFTITEGVGLHPTGADDWLIIWNRHGAIELEANEWEKRGGTVIVAENGYLQAVDKTIYAISVHGHNGSGWYPIDETENRFAKLGIELQPWQDNDHGHWLVCGQRGIGSASMRSPPQWGEKVYTKLKRMGLPVRLRQHPGNFVAKVPLTRDLENCRVCVIWSSGSGVKALVEGIAVQHSAPHWICAGFASEQHREAGLNRMAHGQWHHEEVASGEPFARIIDQREKAFW